MRGVLERAAAHPATPPPAGGENADDAFYRYKMPKLQARVRRWWERGGRAAAGGDGGGGWWVLRQGSAALTDCHSDVLQIEGRGNGIKTNVVNNADIAKALDRPADCEPPPLRFAACRWRWR